MDLSEQRCFLVAGDIKVVKIEPLIERLVEVTADIVGDVAVEPLRVLDQVQRVAKDRRADGQLFASVRQAGLRAFSLIVNVAQFGADLRLGEGVVSGEVDQSRFSFVQFFESAGQRRVQFVRAGLVVSHGLFELFAYILPEGVGQSQGDIVLDDRLFDELSAEMWEVAEPFLTSSAEKVAVPLLGLPCRFGIDEAGRAPLLMATLAEQDALEVVGQDAVTLTCITPEVEDVLDTVEDIMADDRLVSAGIDRTLVDDES